MTERQLLDALKDAAKAYDADIRALKKTYMQDIAALQNKADESAAKKVRSSLRNHI